MATLVRDKVVRDQRPPRVRIIYQRAHHRGEIDLERIPATVLLMDLKPPRPARIQSIVDELFLPLVQNHQEQARPRHASGR